MKTIAISIDETTLDALDRVVRNVPRSGRGKDAHGGQTSSRSAVVRRALHEFLDRHQRSAREAKERRAIARHRELLARQAAALVREQAIP